tara:strand:+ start:7542 stop:7703 length:162 start_codon:yes stop_codon:yes gene_type:complete
MSDRLLYRMGMDIAKEGSERTCLATIKDGKIQIPSIIIVETEDEVKRYLKDKS